MRGLTVGKKKKKVGISRNSDLVGIRHGPQLRRPHRLEMKAKRLHPGGGQGPLQAARRLRVVGLQVPQRGLRAGEELEDRGAEAGADAAALVERCDCGGGETGGVKRVRGMGGEKRENFVDIKEGGKSKVDCRKIVGRLQGNSGCGEKKQKKKGQGEHTGSCRKTHP